MVKEMATEGTVNPQRWAELAAPDERPRRDIGRLFYKASRRDPKIYEYGKTL